MKSEDNLFNGEEAREALQAICDMYGFSLVEDIVFEKRNGKYVSARFEVHVDKMDCTLGSTLNENTVYEVLSHGKWVNHGGNLFSNNAGEREEAMRSYLASSCREVLMKMLGHIVKVSDFDDVKKCGSEIRYEIPDANSVEELKLKLELM